MNATPQKLPQPAALECCSVGGYGSRARLRRPGMTPLGQPSAAQASANALAFRATSSRLIAGVNSAEPRPKPLAPAST